MKKLFLTLILCFLTQSSVAFDPKTWNIDIPSLNPKPKGNNVEVYYDPQKVVMNQTAIVPDPNRPLSISIPHGIQFDNTKPISITLGSDPIPIVLDLGEGGADIMENFNENFKENIAPQLKETCQIIAGTVLNLENAVRFGLPIAIFGVVALSGFYGSRVAWKVIEKNLLSPKPRILQPGSKYGWYDRWQRNRKGYKTPAMIFDELIKERLEEIQAKTTSIRNNIRKGRKLTYDNLLLYGKPGTGKTLFAQILADHTDMDFLCVTAASLLQSGVEGIKYFDEILEMAAKSKYGLILFIDEADALFVNRDMLQPDSDHYKVLNHILAATGSGSSKMMVIAATNYAYVIDPAMGRRFQERVKMLLPSQKTREELLQLYINQYLCDEISVGLTQAKKARFIFTSQRINEIAQETAGLSHAEIKDMIVIMAKKAGTSTNGILTEKHITSSIAQAVEKKSALAIDKKKLKKKNNQNEH